MITKSQNIYINIENYNDIELGTFRVTRQYGEPNLFPRVTTRENDNSLEIYFSTLIIIVEGKSGVNSYTRYKYKKALANIREREAKWSRLGGQTPQGVRVNNFSLFSNPSYLPEKS